MKTCGEIGVFRGLGERGLDAHTTEARAKGGYANVIRRLAVLAALGGAVLRPAGFAGGPESYSVGRVERLNIGFAAWLAQNPISLAAEQRIFVPPGGPSLAERSDEWVFESLQLLSSELCDALDAFDAGNYSKTREVAGRLAHSANPYLAAHAEYLEARAIVALGHLEEAEERLSGGALALDPRLNTFAPQALFLLAHCQFGNLRFGPAARSLSDVARYFPDAAEAVLVGSRQLALEIERRESGTLGEVATLMDYSARRLDVRDATERVQTRQDEALAMLDKLIEQAQQREQQQQQGGGRPQRAQRQPSASPLEESQAGRGAGSIGDLHTAPKANPGELWGKLPPVDRERILQRLREKYPSRYRQLVEQYYRSLAEQP